MEITFNKSTALAIMRAYRAAAPRSRKRAVWTDLQPPSPEPQQRFTRGLFDAISLPGSCTLAGKKLHIAVPSTDKRVRGRDVSSTVYGEGSLPARSFLSLGDGLSISGPELLFVEMADQMHPIDHLMLGHELCGTFSRDAEDPFNGPVAYHVKPMTSVAKIHRFLAQSKNIHGISEARASLELLNDNAWSPTESLIAAMLRSHPDDTGYGFGELVLNERVEGKAALPGAKGSRVPDIVVAGTSVGINYDGLLHLNLDSIVDAALQVGMRPETARTQRELDQAVRDVRAKAVDDIRRNRELAIDGMTVLPVLKEDLYTPGGLDAIVRQLIRLIEREGTLDLSWQKRLLGSKSLSKERHRKILSLLPGKHERDVKLARFIQGCMVSEGPMTVHECIIEL